VVIREGAPGELPVPLLPPLAPGKGSGGSLLAGCGLSGSLTRQAPGCGTGHASGPELPEGCGGGPRAAHGSRARVSGVGCAQRRAPQLRAPAVRCPAAAGALGGVQSSWCNAGAHGGRPQATAFRCVPSPPCAPLLLRPPLLVLGRHPFLAASAPAEQRPSIGCEGERGIQHPAVERRGRRRWAGWGEMPREGGSWWPL